MGIHVFPILNPPPTSLPIPSLWVIPVHQPQASCILHWTWTGDSFLIWYYTCFNAILPNHPPSLSHRVQKIVLYICVSFAVSHTVLSLLILKKINLSEEKFAKLKCWGRFYSRLLQESSEITIDFGRQRTQSKHSYVQYLMIWNHGENAIPKWSQRRADPALFCLYEI